MIAETFFSNCQYGFRPGRGTGNALVASTCVWHQHLDAGADVCCAFFDFKKAFDSIPHESLLNKLSLLQIHPALFRWLRDYLSSRCQRVVFENSSEFLPVTSGVPQGSILGPLLFLIYINDYYHYPFQQTRYLCCMLMIYPFLNFCIVQKDMSIMQSDIEKISDWSEANHLNINVAKTKYMIISRKKKAIPYFSLFLNGHQLERVSSFRLLGVIIDENLRGLNILYLSVPRPRGPWVLFIDNSIYVIRQPC